MAAGYQYGRCITITWSLAIEEHFYLLLPALIWMAPAKRLPHILLMLVALAVLSRTAVLLLDVRQDPEGVNYLLTTSHWDGLFVGTIGAWLSRHPRWSPYIRDNRWIICAIALIIGILIIIAHLRVFTAYRSISGLFMYTLVAIFYLAVIFLGLHTDLGSWMARRKLLVFLGSISYGAYLMHQLVAVSVRQVLGVDRSASNSANLLVVLIAFPATIGVAWLSYRYFESPIVRWGHRLDYEHAPPRNEPDDSKSTAS
jgi:peptidoglycan/LPS O-acetylase OafA/YrhL